ncbi:MAG: CDP-alcohol phosphatidyltransferase family protein [Proteobacteria bacterium]|nr:CDP-alcohol phosphatidyltransferase family protein [Pseudomonadota bacterium]
MNRRTLVVILPTALTLARLCAVPLTIWLIQTGEFAVAFWVFVAAGVTDALDGALARWFDARTTIGSYLDPIADKALLVSVYIALAVQGLVPAWLTILVVFRDLLIVGGVLLSHTLGQPVVMAPLAVSRLNTVAQIVLAGLVLAMAGMDIADSGIAAMMVAVAAATTAISGAAYAVKWVRRLAGLEPT